MKVKLESCALQLVASSHDNTNKYYTNRSKHDDVLCSIKPRKNVVGAAKTTKSVQNQG